MASQELQKLEKDIAVLLLDKLEHLQITLQRAGEISRFVISVLPDTLTDEQVKKIIPSLDDKFFELAEVVHKYLKKYEEAEKTQLAGQAAYLIKKGEHIKASELMKNYFNSKNL